MIIRNMRTITPNYMIRVTVAMWYGNATVSRLAATAPAASRTAQTDDALVHHTHTYTYTH